MQRLIFLLIALALVGGTTYLLLKTTAASTRPAAAEGPSAPKERLDRMRNVARGIEQDTQKRIDDLAKRSQ